MSKIASAWVDIYTRQTNLDRGLREARTKTETYLRDTKRKFSGRCPGRPRARMYWTELRGR